MSKGISCSTPKQASDYVAALREQGYDSKVFRDNGTGTYQVMIVAPQQKVQRTRVQSASNAGGGIIKAAKMIGRGLGDIGQSLGTPSTNRRPRIAQLPASRKEIGIAQSLNLERLKMPMLRGKDISGRKRGF